MASLDNKIVQYRFTLNDAVISGANNFETGLYWTNRSELEYRVGQIGKDNNGFYFSYAYYTINEQGEQVLSYNGRQYWSQQTSGDFIIEFAPYTYPQSNITIPDDVYNGCITIIEMTFSTNSERMTGTIELKHSEGSPITGYYGGYFEIFLTPIGEYRFIDADVPVIVTVPDFKNGGYKEYTLTNSTTGNHKTMSEILQDGKLRIWVLIGGGYYQLSDLGYKSVEIGDVLGKLVKSEYNVELVLQHASASNTATTVILNSEYVNVLTADNGYSMDEVEVIVTMDNRVVEGAYNPQTRTVTIAHVTGDIVITATAKKLYTFRFYSSNGQTLRATVERYSIKNILISLIGSTRTIKIDGVTIATYSEAIPENHSLVGLSLSANSNRPVIQLDYVYSGSYNENTDFFECIVEVPDYGETMTINLYHNKSKKNVLFKELVTVGTALTGTLREKSSIINPSIIIERHGVLDFDYVFIPQFKRYYYVTEVISIKRDLWLIGLRVDVLMTYQSLIRLQTCYVLRNEFEGDDDKTDTYISFDYDKQIKYEVIPYDDINKIYDFSEGNAKDLSCILKVIGG